MRNRYEILPALFFILLAAFVIIHSYQLGLGIFQNPGPGMMPFLLGIGLLFVALLIGGKSLSAIRHTSDAAERESPSKTDFLKSLIVSGSLVIYSLLLEQLGFLLLTSVLLIALFKTAGSTKWIYMLLGAIATVIVTYLVFSYLGVRLPEGLLRF